MNYLAQANRRSMSTSCRKLELYYDVVSPYSWYAFEILQRYQKRWNLDVVYKPVLVGGVFKSASNSAPGVVPAKAKAALLDIKRCTKYYKVPVLDTNFAEMMANGSMQPMRFVTAVKMYLPNRLSEVSRQFWMKRFKTNQDFNPVEAMKDVGAKAGMDSKEIEMILSKISTPEVKEQLKMASQEAVDKGAFGVPTFFVELDGKSEMFFGADRFPMVAQTIGEEWAGPDPDLTSKL